MNHAPQSDDWVPECLHPDTAERMAEHMPTRWNKDLQNLTYVDKAIREGALQTARMALETGIPRNTDPPPSQIR